MNQYNNIPTSDDQWPWIKDYPVKQLREDIKRHHYKRAFETQGEPSRKHRMLAKSVERSLRDGQD